MATMISDPETGWDNDGPVGDVAETASYGSRSHLLKLPPEIQINEADSDSESEWEVDLEVDFKGDDDTTESRDRRRKPPRRYDGMPALYSGSRAGLDNDVPRQKVFASDRYRRRKRRERRSYKPQRRISSKSISDDSCDNIFPKKQAQNVVSHDAGHRTRRHRHNRSISRSGRSKDSSRYSTSSRSGGRDGRSKASSSKSSERHRDRSRGSGSSKRRTLKKSVSFSGEIVEPVEPVEEQVSIDESERLEVYFNHAAKRIQEKFRQAREQSSDTESFEEETSQNSTDTTVEEVDPEKLESIITSAFILIFSVAMMSKRWIIKCFNGCRGNQKRSARRHNNGNNNDDDPEVVNPDEVPMDGDANMQGQPQTGPTTGPTAPAPGGMESMMATQAASSAAGGAASGVSAGLAAGAAAAGTATSAMAAAGIAASATQLATAAVVGTTVVVASSVVASNVLSETPTPFPFISTCGIESPVIRGGTIGLSFEGFEREFDSREQQLVETLVLDSYNLITRGPNQEAFGCTDAYLREMQNSTMIDQVFNAGNGDNPTTLDVTFDASVICNGCPDALPMFGRFANNDGASIIRRLQSVGDDLNAEVDFDLLDQLLKEVARKIVTFTNSGELEESFIPSKIGAKGQLFSSNTNSEGNDTSVIFLTVPIGYEEATSSNGRELIFPAPSVCGSTDPDFYPGIWRISLEGVARAIVADEIGVIEQLMLETYNGVAIGINEQRDCIDRYQREMSRARLVDQQFVPVGGNDTVSALEMTFKTWLICNGCSDVIPLFGTAADEIENDDEPSYDFGMMETALREVIARMVGLINRDILPSSLIPSKASILPPTQDGSNGGGQGTAFEPLLGVPIIIETDENGEILASLPKPSACGLLDPSLYPGELRMTFEGFERVFTEAEAALIQPIVLSSYNTLTKGPSTEEGVCVDPYNREMTSADLANQTFSVPPGGDEVSVLDLVFETWVTCGGCSEEEAVFGSAGSFRRRTQDSVGGDSMDLDFVEIHMEEVVAGIFELVRIGALPAIFIPNKVYVKGREPGGASGAVLLDVPILVNYREQTGYVVQFPGPSQAPTMSMVPSSMPSDVPSLSMVPSYVPSDVPSNVPSDVPSETPSMVPSFVPSMVPSYVPSTLPSMVPSFVPSETPSFVPSFVPSVTPSFVPSDVPSDSPSDNPSGAPSASPSKIPSTSPSKSPTSFPTTSPSKVPTASPTRQRYQGCYVDADPRAMAAGGSPALNDMASMTVEMCRTHCRNNGYEYAGLQVKHECWCDNSFSMYGAGSGCEVGCNGGGSEPCGAGWRLSVYWSGL
mmetsp:Transcript_41717/g.100467  ORF Transcript_41717/g.100467 Transcript_41717/m.100467 type:complete len:1305 (-) Transcript_41717:526-4440(-)